MEIIFIYISIAHLGGAKSSTLKQVELKLVPPEFCKNQYGETKMLPLGIDNKKQICAGSPGKDTCIVS